MIIATSKWKAPILTTVKGAGSLRKPEGAKSYGERIEKLLVDAGYAEYYQPASDSAATPSEAEAKGKDTQVQESAVDTPASTSTDTPVEQPVEEDATTASESDDSADSSSDSQSTKGKRKTKGTTTGG